VARTARKGRCRASLGGERMRMQLAQKACVTEEMTPISPAHVD